MANILVADDKAVARRAILSVLNDEFATGMTYLEAENGSEAVEKAKAFHPEVVILELVMIGNGLKAAQEIAKNCPETKLLATSVYDAKPLFGRLKQAGVRGFVPKSSLGVELGPAVEVLLRGKTFFGLPCSLSVVAAAAV